MVHICDFDRLGPQPETEAQAIERAEAIKKVVEAAQKAVDKQKALDKSKLEFRYGDSNTTHRTGEVNVELDSFGRVVSVWFRCMALPFTQHVVSNDRAGDMLDMYDEIRATRPNSIKAIVFEEKP